MLKIKNVSARNFMSIGAQTQAVNFDNCNLTLVLGHNLDMGGDGSRNGTGKTTIINALSYALYGEALTNIKKDNLINKTNGKGMIVTVDFEINNKTYRIERGRKPNILRLIVDGNDTGDTSNEDDDAQGDSRETQKEIEKIIGFPHEMFKHIIALNTYTEPFLAMKSNDQRAMIELLLGITDLSKKADILKELLKQSKDSIKEEEIRISAVKLSNERIEKNITEIESRGRAWDKTKADKLADMLTTIETLNEIDISVEIDNHKQNQEIKEKSDAKTVLDNEKDRTDTSFNRSNKKLAELKNNLQKAHDGQCPACGQSTAHLDTHEEYTRELVGKIAEEQKYNDEVTARLAEISEALDSFGTIGDEKDTFYDTLEAALEHKHNLETLATQYAEKLEEINPYVEQIESLRNTGLQDVSFDLINELTYLKDHQEFLHKLLTSKDSFIRKKIIDQNISYLNHRLAYYIEKIGLPHDVKFNSDLSVEITEYGRDLDFDNLSRGERNRLILSLSWAFRDVYESLNHPMNLMCVDELIDSGMDTIGVENSLAILKKMNREQHKNIFLISHKEELVGRVNNVLTVIKEGGFTSYNTDTEYVE
jgi:DNA repair exonuclease SbcCD ATPase subunit